MKMKKVAEVKDDKQIHFKAIFNKHLHRNKGNGQLKSNNSSSSNNNNNNVIVLLL
jgi:hypothetical protein